MSIGKKRFFPLFSKILVYLLVCTFALPGTFFRASAVHADGKVKVVVNDLKSNGLDDLLLETLTNLIKESINKTGKHTVVTSGDGVDQVIVGTVEKIGDSYNIELKLLDGEKARTINTHVEKIREALPDRIEKAASSLVLGVEQEGPTIRHTPLASKKGKENIVISAIITDDSKVANVNLHYRVQGKTPFSAIPMVEVGNGQYEGLIPASDVTQSGVEYYFEALDTTGNRTSEGTLAQPHFIAVQIDQAPKKKSNWWKWALGAVAVAGIGVALGGSGGGGGDSDGGSANVGNGGVTVSW